MKVCITCKIPKSLDEFGNYKRYADGKHRICRTCWNEQSQVRRHANGVKPIPPFLDRLWGSIQQCGHEDACPYCCWPWLKTHDEDGYGKFSLSYNGRHTTHPVVRIIFELWHAMLLPPDMCACHYCDNPGCCNPLHLWKGTRVDNRLDCVQKGRQAKGLRSGRHTHPEAFPQGEDRSNAKLSNQEARDIRQAHSQGISASRLGKRYGVSKFAILSVIHYRTYKNA
jgi:hypothetical protein